MSLRIIFKTCDIIFGKHAHYCLICFVSGRTMSQRLSPIKRRYVLSALLLLAVAGLVCFRDTKVFYCETVLEFGLR